MEQDRRRMALRRKLKAGLFKALVFVFILALAVLVFAIAGTTR